MTKEDHEDEHEEREEHPYIKNWKGLGKLPTLSDFDSSYKNTLDETKEFYKKSGNLTEPFNEFVRGKKRK